MDFACSYADVLLSCKLRVRDLSWRVQGLGNLNSNDSFGHEAQCFKSALDCSYWC